MIRLEGIHREFEVGEGKVHALSRLDLEIHSGEYLAIMGPSGSGKSTLLNILGLLDRPDGGRYLLDEIDTQTLSEAALAEVRRERIGFVFQAFHLIPRFTAAENVALPLVFAGVAPAERRRRVAPILEQLGMADRAEHRPDQLSGGQRQRVAIARAVVMEPTLILADEPTGNLDRASGEEVIRTLESLNGRGITLITVTHDPEIGGRAERLIRIEDGAVVRHTPGETGGPG